jgi:hypothetical protein
MKHWLLATFLFACGGSQGQAPVEPDPAPAHANADAGSAVAEPATDGNALTREECEGLFEHLFQIEVEHQRATLPEEERPTAADWEKAKASMREARLGECVGTDRVEFRYDCAMKAADRAGLKACVGAK